MIMLKIQGINFLFKVLCCSTVSSESNNNQPPWLLSNIHNTWSLSLSLSHIPDEISPSDSRLMIADFQKPIYMGE